MWHYVIVKIAVLVGLTEMHKTGCSEATQLVLHVPSSSWEAAEKRLVIVTIVIIVAGKGRQCFHKCWRAWARIWWP